MIWSISRASKSLHSENSVLDEFKPWREEVIGKDQKYISEVELGRIIPGFRNADTLARFLGVPVERIFPCFTRTSRFPGYKNLMYLYSLGYDIGVYEGAVRELTTKEAQNDG